MRLILDQFHGQVKSITICSSSLCYTNSTNATTAKFLRKAYLYQCKMWFYKFDNTSQNIACIMLKPPFNGHDADIICEHSTEQLDNAQSCWISLVTKNMSVSDVSQYQESIMLKTEETDVEQHGFKTDLSTKNYFAYSQAHKETEILTLNTVRHKYSSIATLGTPGCYVTKHTALTQSDPMRRWIPT